MARRLKTISDTRRFLARIITQLEQGNIEPTIAGRLMYGLNIMGKLLEIAHQQSKVDALVARLDELEARLGE
jgi:hypothetical protein